MVDGLARRREVTTALEVFEAMPERNLVSWALMISGYAENGMFVDPRKLFEAMLEKNVAACTLIITGCCKAGDVEITWSLYVIRVKDEISWNPMISEYVHNGVMDTKKQLRDCTL
uniref:Pentatricopeptide repeat-containing protein n=1 Tax=Arundo donax TaxID=35708 RepID=A0A0A8YWE3_ARUDO